MTALELARDAVLLAVWGDDKVAERARAWHRKSDDALRLALGELTAQEIRTLRAVLTNIVDA